MNAPSLARLGAIAALALGLGLATSPASAQSLDPIFLGGFNCPTANCKAMKIVGRVNGQDTRANPYVAMFGVGAGGCPPPRHDLPADGPGDDGGRPGRHHLHQRRHPDRTAPTARA